MLKAWARVCCHGLRNPKDRMCTFLAVQKFWSSPAPTSSVPPPHKTIPCAASSSSLSSGFILFPPSMRERTRDLLGAVSVRFLHMPLLKHTLHTYIYTHTHTLHSYTHIHIYTHYTHTLHSYTDTHTHTHTTFIHTHTHTHARALAPRAVSAKAIRCSAPRNLNNSGRPSCSASDRKKGLNFLQGWLCVLLVIRKLFGRAIFFCPKLLFIKDHLV